MRVQRVGCNISKCMVKYYQRKKEVLSRLINTKTLLLLLGIRHFYLDRSTIKHCNDTANICLVLSSELGLSSEDIKLLYVSALLHDIGKCYIPKEILNSKNRLSEEERVIIDLHSLYGYSVLKKYGLPKDLCDLVFLHHGIDKVSKWYDIKYLSERALRLHKILKIADIYSAVTTKRSYHNAISHNEAVNLLKTIELMDRDFLKVLDIVPTKRSFGISFSCM